MAWHADATDPERTRELGRVQTACAAEGDQREEAWVVAALDRDHAQRALHRRRHHGDHARRCSLDGAAEPPRQGSQRATRALDVEPHLAAEELALHQATEDEIS